VGSEVDSILCELAKYLQYTYGSKMLIDAETIETGTIIKSDIAVIGSGPAGTVLALELASAGFDIALIESGGLKFSAESQDLSTAENFDPRFHASMSDCTRRQLGGTSAIWGGRCLPYDPVDFDRRPYIPDSNWPILYEEIENYFARACSYLLCGNSEFDIENIPNIDQKSIIPGLPDTEVLTSKLERWSLPTNFGKEYFHNFKQSEKIKVFYNLTCTEIETSEQGNQVESLHLQTLNGKKILIKCRKYVLAGGALNTTRLLMVSDRNNPGGIGNHSGLLGRFYMGHLSGNIATAHFTTAAKDTVFGFDRDSDKIYLRRRFSFTREFLHEKQLSNTVAWLGVPEFGDSSHHNGILSAAYLALSIPGLRNYLTPTATRKMVIGEDAGKCYRSHISNVLRDFKQVLTFIPYFGYERYIVKRKIPALFVYSGANEYPLHYHSEQVPNYNSIVSLSDKRDNLGMSRLNIDIKFMQQDINNIINAHEFWDRHLRKYDCGYLKYKTDDLVASVWEQAGDGFHQVGTTRMSANPKNGVVGTNCNVHGIDNLFVASSSVFVTSGQANSTFMIVSFALRLADHLKKV
jgi:choline dehydrogenase-like flavoprotein